MATSMIRRIRPLLEPTRSWNQRARALPGWWRSHSQASSIAVRLARGLPDLAMPWSRRTAPLCHGLSSSSMVSQRMAASFGIEFPDGVVDGLIEVVRSGEGLVSEMMPLQVAPETLDIVQLRSVFRQPLDPEPMSPLGEGGTSRLAGVDRTVVEDQNEGLDRDAELGTIAAVDLLQESDEV